MLEYVIKQFITSFFVGVLDVTFFEMGGTRNIQILFNNHDDLMRSWELADIAKEIFLVDEDTLTFIADRDMFETVMYYTAAKDAMTTWMRKLIEDKDKQEFDDYEEHEEERNVEGGGS